MAFAISRNARLFVTTEAGEINSVGDMDSLTDANTWRIPVLDGYSFSQSTTTQDLVISEAGEDPARGSQTFNTALEPVNWSFSNYLRPRYDGINTSTADAIERIMWEALSSDPTSTITTGSSGLGTTRGPNSMDVDFEDSNTNELKQVGLLFDLDGIWYFINGGVVDTAEIDFSIDSIASITWTGFGTSIKNVTEFATTDWADPTGTAHDATGGFPGTNQFLDIPTENLACIRNKLTTVLLTDNEATAGFGAAAVTALAITGGSLTIANNITFLTPEALGVVNQPCGHFTGARTVSGNITAYLKTDPLASGDLLGYLAKEVSRATPFDFDFQMYIGGTVSDASSATTNPIIHLDMAHTHLVIPTINTEDVLTIDMGFNALPFDESANKNDLNFTNEVLVHYWPVQ